MKKIFVGLSKGAKNVFNIEDISMTPKEGFEEVKSLEFKAERNWSVGYSAREADSLTERYALRGIFNSGKARIEGTRNNMGANSDYYLTSAKINGRDIQYWFGHSEFMFNKVLEHLGMKL